MPESARATAPRALLPGWRRWTGVVAACARRTWSPGLGDARSYADLYQEVMGACREAAAAATGPEREFYEMLGGLVSPWMTLEALTRTERDILGDLLQRSREAERRLSGRRDWSRWKSRLSAGALAVAAALALAAVLALALDWWLYAFAGRLRALAVDVRFAWRNLGETWQALIVGGAAVLCAAVLLRRLARR
jgi:hypothetical protein